MLTVVWVHGKGSEENGSNYITALILHLCFDSSFYGLEKSTAVADKFFLSEIQYSEFSIFPTVFDREDTILQQISKSIFPFVPVNCQRQWKQPEQEVRLQAKSMFLYNVHLPLPWLSSWCMKKLKRSITQLFSIALAFIYWPWLCSGLKSRSSWRSFDHLPVKNTRKSYLFMKYSSEVWNSGLNSCLSYRTPMDVWPN